MPLLFSFTPNSLCPLTGCLLSSGDQTVVNIHLLGELYVVRTEPSSKFTPDCVTMSLKLIVNKAPIGLLDDHLEVSCALYGTKSLIEVSIKLLILVRYHLIGNQ